MNTALTDVSSQPLSSLSSARRRYLLWWAISLVLVLAIPGAGVLMSGLLLLCLIGLSPAVRRALGRPARSRSRQLLDGLLIGLTLTLLANEVIDPLAAWIGGQAADHSALGNVQGNLSAYVQLLLAGLIIGGVLEELLFRGFLIGFGLRLFGRRALLPVLICSCLAFSLAHAYQGVTGMLSTGALGTLLALAWVWRGSLLSNIAAHATVNAIGITSMYLGAS